MTECCEGIVEICFTIFSGSGFFTVLLYAPSMAKLRDEEFNFCNKIVILKCHSAFLLWLCAWKHVRKKERKVVRRGRTRKVTQRETETERGRDQMQHFLLSCSDFKAGELIAWWVKCPKGNEGHKEGARDERWAGVGACELRAQGLFWSWLQKQKATRCFVVAAPAASSRGARTKDSQAVGGEKCFVISASSSGASSKNYSLTFIIGLFRTCCGGTGMLTAPAFRWDT